MGIYLSSIQLFQSELIRSIQNHFKLVELEKNNDANKKETNIIYLREVFSKILKRKSRAFSEIFALKTNLHLLLLSLSLFFFFWGGGGE